MGFVMGERRGWAALQIQGKGKFIAKVQDDEGGGVSGQPTHFLESTSEPAFI